MSLLSIAQFCLNVARVISLAGKMVDRSGLSKFPDLKEQGELDFESTEQAQDSSPHGGKNEKPVKTPKKPFGRRPKAPS